MGIDVAQVAQVVRRCPVAVDLHCGRDGSVFTDTAGGRVHGVRVSRSGVIVIGVVGSPGVNTVRIVEQVRDAVTGYLPDARVAVRVEAVRPGWSDPLVRGRGPGTSPGGTLTRELHRRPGYGRGSTAGTGCPDGARPSG